MKRSCIRHFLTNIVCGFIPSKTMRKRVRVLLNADIALYIKFVKQDTGATRRQIKIFSGYRGLNVLIGVDKRYVYKFPYRRRNYREIALREQRIIDALRPHLIIPAPELTLVERDGILARRYDYVAAPNHRAWSDKVIMTHCAEYGRIIGRFIFEMSIADPDTIADLKQTNAMGVKTNCDLTPGFMRGWYHNDLEDNILIDPKTMKIVSVIDWEDACFMDFSNAFNVTYPGPWRAIMCVARDEYIRLYKNHFGDKNVASMN